MKCPKCGYEDLIFTPPANVHCPKCGFKYEYKYKKTSIRENIIKDMNEYFAQWGSIHHIQIGAHIEEIINKHFEVKK